MEKTGSLEDEPLNVEPFPPLLDALVEKLGTLGPAEGKTEMVAEHVRRSSCMQLIGLYVAHLP